MSKSKKRIIIVCILVAAGITAGIVVKVRKSKKSYEITGELTASRGRIRNLISTTGSVKPQNRLEIKPPIAGRIEKILVEEGDVVKAGQTVAWMSSTERAALLDAAKPQGEEVLKYWQDAYKPAPLIAPIDGDVIVREFEPGQTVTAASVIIVLSDRLIVQSRVDETDIGKIKIGQAAFISLDAYPDDKVDAKVDHIAYESKTVSNVTIYEVDILPVKVPPFFRSGMSATVDILIENKENVTVLPLHAIQNDRAGSYVYVKEAGNSVPVPRDIEVGISDERNVEIASGVTPEDTIVLVKRKYDPSKKNEKTNPFMPLRRGRRGGSGNAKSNKADRALD